MNVERIGELLNAIRDLRGGLDHDKQKRLIQAALVMDETDLLAIAHDRQRLSWLEQLANNNSGVILEKVTSTPTVVGGVRLLCKGHAPKASKNIRAAIDKAYVDLNPATWKPS